MANGFPFLLSVFPSPPPRGLPRPVAPTPHGPLSALGLPEALPLVAFGGSGKPEGIPGASARAPGSGFPLSLLWYLMVRLYRTEGLSRFSWLCLLT